MVPWGFIQCRGWIARLCAYRQAVYRLSYIPSLESTGLAHLQILGHLQGVLHRDPSSWELSFLSLALWLSLLLPALYLLLARLPRNSEFLPLYYTLLCTWLGQPPQAKAREGGEKTPKVIWRRKRDNGGGFGEWREPHRPGAAFPVA